MTAPNRRFSETRTLLAQNLSRILRSTVLMAAFLAVGGCIEKPIEGFTDPLPEEDFSISIVPGELQLAQGTSAPVEISGTFKNMTGPVALDVFYDLPKGVSMTFVNAPLQSTGAKVSAQLTLAKDAFIEYAVGGRIEKHLVTIRARKGELTRYATFWYTPAPSSEAGITLSTPQPSLEVRRGKFVESDIQVLRQGGYTGPVSLKVYERQYNVGNGVSTTFTPIAGQPDRFRMRVDVAKDARQGDAYKHEIVGSAPGLSPTGILEVAINILPEERDLTPRILRELRIRQGEQDTVTVALNRGSEFRDAVTFSTFSLPTGVTGTFAPSSTAGDATLLTLRVAPSATPATHEGSFVAIKQPDGTTSYASLKLTIEPALQANAYKLIPPNMNVVAGSNGSSIFNVTRNNGFAEPITVKFARADGAALPAGMTLSLDQNPVTGTFTIIRLNTAVTTPAGSYNLVATGATATAAVDTGKFTVVVTAQPVPTTVVIGKLVNGSPVAPANPERIALYEKISLRAVVLDQNGQPMQSEGVDWSSFPVTIVTVENNGDVAGFTPGTTTVTARSKTNPSIRASVPVVVTLAPATTVATFQLEPGNAEITAPASQQFEMVLLASNGTRMAPEANATIEYSSSDATIATVNPATGMVKGVAGGDVKITARYRINGLLVTERESKLKVYPAGSAKHYGSAEISTNMGNTRRVTVGQVLLFQLYVYDVAGLPQGSGVDPLPDVRASNPNVTIQKTGTTGGYFYTMTIGAGVTVGSTFTVRYDVMGAGGEITMKVVP
ncbi:MAG: Ig-like domain-containing protein [Gemmatimonas sp.]